MQPGIRIMVIEMFIEHFVQHTDVEGFQHTTNLTHTAILKINCQFQLLLQIKKKKLQGFGYAQRGGMDL